MVCIDGGTSVRDARTGHANNWLRRLDLDQYTHSGPGYEWVGGDWVMEGHSVVYVRGCQTRPGLAA